MEPDPRIAFFSNNGTIGTTGVGVEGWHVDGNVAENPHAFTLIYCEKANFGATLVVPQRDLYETFDDKEKEYLETINFVGAHTGVKHPLVYRHPIR